MPTLENTLPSASPKTLNRKMSRSALVWSARKAAFMGTVIPRLERAHKTLHERLQVLRAPVEKLDADGKTVLVHDDASLVRVVQAMLQTIEMERSLLGFPSPGRRRDERAERIVRETNVPTDVDATSVSTNVHAVPTEVGQAVSKPTVECQTAVSDSKPSAQSSS